MARLTDRSAEELAARAPAPPADTEVTERTHAPEADAPAAHVAEADGAGAPPRRRFGIPRTFDSLREREFRWYYVAMLGQMAAMNMQLVVRGYLAFVLTGSYAALGLVSLSGALPMLLLSMFGGVLADRMPKRTVLQVGQFLSMGNAGALALLVFLGMMRFEWLLVSAVAQSIVMALTQPSRQSMVPEIVGMDRMMNAVSLSMAGMNTMRLFAPAAGGFIVEFFGFGWAFIGMAAMYGIAIVGLARVTWQPATAPAESGSQGFGEAGRSSVRDIVEGFRYIRGDRVMFALLTISFVSAIFGMPYQFLIPGYVADIFQGSAADVGRMLAISAVGALAGALLLATIPSRKRGWLLIIGTLFLSVGLFAFAQTANYWVAAIFVIVIGLGSSFRQALSQGLLHTYVENEYRGRVMAVFMMQVSLMQLGVFIVGVIAEFIGIRTAFAGLGIILALTTLAFTVFVPSIRRLE